MTDKPLSSSLNENDNAREVAHQAKRNADYAFVQDEAAVAKEYGPIVQKIARKYMHPSNAGWKDLIQEGYIGLLKAARTYDPTKGARFSVYAKTKIEGYILHARRDARALPRSVYDALVKVINQAEARAQEMGHNVSAEDFQVAMQDCSVSQASIILINSEIACYLRTGTTHTTASLEDPIHSESGKRTFHDVVPSKRVSVEDDVLLNDLYDQVSEALYGPTSPLNDKRRHIIIECVVKDKDRPQVSRELGMPPSSISRIKVESLNILAKRLGIKVGAVEDLLNISEIRHRVEALENAGSLQRPPFKRTAASSSSSRAAL